MYPKAFVLSVTSLPGYQLNSSSSSATSIRKSSLAPEYSFQYSGLWKAFNRSFSSFFASEKVRKWCRSWYAIIIFLLNPRFSPLRMRTVLCLNQYIEITVRYMCMIHKPLKNTKLPWLLQKYSIIMHTISYIGSDGELKLVLTQISLMFIFRSLYVVNIYPFSTNHQLVQLFLHAY